MGTIDLRHVDGHDAVDPPRRSDLYRRAFDVLAATVLLLVALPVMVLVTVACAASLRAWPFFAQDRVGRGGQRFRFHKVRTLPPSAPAYIDKHQLDLGAVPRLCRWVRDLHLDELPQLLLVLRGHMSLVGPRPEMPHLHDQLHPDFAVARTSIRPGCTGLWQISGSARNLIGDAPEYDAWYVTNRSLRLDLWVLYRTVRKMTGLGDSITLDDLPSWVLTERAEPARRRHEGAESPALTAPVGSGR